MEKTDVNGSFFWVEEHNEQTPIPVKQKRKLKTKKVEFVGWGSKSLIEFLQSIGKDSSKQLTQYDVSAIVHEYVHTFNLLNPMKKKRVDCDERLYSLFGKKSIPRNKIHELLNTHFAENNDSSEDDLVYSSEEFDDGNTKFKKRKVSSTEKKAPSVKKNAPETQFSCFASIIPENIKLLYLKKSLVEEIVKQPESFERKLLGSYIRIKSDPNDYSQKNSHQLHPVTGVKNVVRNGDVHAEVLLQVPNMIKDIPISILSDQDFSKEECEDLCQRVKDGLIKRPTVVEVEQKAQILREDIMKHWLPRELAYLQNLIDRANEKGWRKELFEYLERKKLLQNPSEQSKLFTEVPKVTADMLEPEARPQELVEEQLNGFTNPAADKLELEATQHEQVRVIEQLNRSTNPVLSSHSSDATEYEVMVLDGADDSNAEPVKNVGSGQQLTGFQWVEVEQKYNIKSLDQTLDLNNVIELSDDEDETPEPEKEKKIETEEKTEKETKPEQENEFEFSCRKWFYLDPQGNIQGPFSRNELKQWSDAGYFLPDFKVWKDGQTPEWAILLIDMLSG